MLNGFEGGGALYTEDETVEGGLLETPLEQVRPKATSFRACFGARFDG